MEILNVIAAAIAAFGFGAVWYTVLAKPWLAVSGVALVDGKPSNANDVKPFVIGFASAILVAGMMRHAFVTGGINTVWGGAVGGFGIGLFFAAPWLATCYAFVGRPFRLTLIDGGYAVGGSTLAGIVLMLF